MKAMIACACVALLWSSCTQPAQQYTESSPEIDTCKELIAAYEAGNFDEFANAYADTAKLYHNSVEGQTIQEITTAWNESLAPFSEYGFDDDIEFEFVTTDEGEQWVGWWGIWHGTLAANGQEFSIPVHVSAQFIDGKIVKEWGYWDNQPIAAALAELAAAEAEGEEDSDE